MIYPYIKVSGVNGEAYNYANHDYVNYPGRADKPGSNYPGYIVYIPHLHTPSSVVQLEPTLSLSLVPPHSHPVCSSPDHGTRQNIQSSSLVCTTKSKIKYKGYLLRQVVFRFT